MDAISARKTDLPKIHPSGERLLPVEIEVSPSAPLPIPMSNLLFVSRTNLVMVEGECNFVIEIFEINTEEHAITKRLSIVLASYVHAAPALDNCPEANTVTVTSHDLAHVLLSTGIDLQRTNME